MHIRPLLTFVTGIVVYGLLRHGKLGGICPTSLLWVCTARSGRTYRSGGQQNSIMSIVLSQYPQVTKPAVGQSAPQAQAKCTHGLQAEVTRYKYAIQRD